MCGSRRGDRAAGPPGKSQKYRFLCNTDLEPLNNHKATKPVLNVGPSSAHQKRRLMAFCWWADDGPFLVVFWIHPPFIN